MMVEEDMEHQQCVNCGVHWMMPRYILDSRRKDKVSFYCPNGHGQSFRESEIDVLRRERDRLKQQTARLEDEAREARECAEKAERATKRLKKRASAGTCPCCKRTFSNMAEHMKHQHPAFVAEGGAAVVPLKRARS